MQKLMQKPKTVVILFKAEQAAQVSGREMR